MTKMVLPIHGPDHAKGGPDPVPFDLSWCYGYKNTLQSVTATAELQFDSVFTNDDEVFRWDDTDPAGILIIKPGYYLFHAVVRFSFTYSAVSKTIYQQAQPLSSGPGLFGNELGETLFSLGTGQGETGIGQAPGPSSAHKSELAHLAIANAGDAADPSRYVVALQHNGTDYEAPGLPAVSWIVRLGAYSAGHAAIAPDS